MNNKEFKTDLNEYSIHMTKIKKNQQNLLPVEKLVTINKKIINLVKGLPIFLAMCASSGFASLQLIAF